MVVYFYVTFFFILLISRIESNIESNGCSGVHEFTGEQSECHSRFFVYLLNFGTRPIVWVKFGRGCRRWTNEVKRCKIQSHRCDASMTIGMMQWTAMAEAVVGRSVGRCCNRDCVVNRVEVLICDLILYSNGWHMLHRRSVDPLTRWPRELL